MYFRCCPSCKAWTSNHIGVGCLPTTKDQESEIQKIISYSYEDITSHSVDEVNPEKEEETRICNLCEELHKKRKPIDAFTEALEIETTTEETQDYETLYATLPHSTTNMNKLGPEILEIETSTNEMEDVPSIQDSKDENSKRDNKKVSTKEENNEETINYEETSTEDLKKSKTLTKKKFKEKRNEDDDIMNYEKSSELNENIDKVPKLKKIDKEKNLDNGNQDVEMIENVKSSQEDIIENQKDDSKNLDPKIRKKSKEGIQENESDEHDKEKTDGLKKEESSGSGDEYSSGSGGSEDNDVYNGYGGNIATLKMGK